MTSHAAQSGLIESVDSTVTFAGGDLSAWKKIGEISHPTELIGRCSLEISMVASAPPVTQYGDSLEVALVPLLSPSGSDEPFVVIPPEPARLACAVGWLWGTGPAATPLSAGTPWLAIHRREVIYAERLARRWVAYARSGMAAGEAITLSVRSRLTGQLGVASGGFERVNPICTVPPYLPGGARSQFPNPSSQPSFSPRKWVGNTVVQAVVAGAYRLHVLGGGPWIGQVRTDTSALTVAATLRLMQTASSGIDEFMTSVAIAAPSANLWRLISDGFAVADRHVVTPFNAAIELATAELVAVDVDSEVQLWWPR
jgi:hypothetical protein